MNKQDYLNTIDAMNKASMQYYDGIPSQFTDEEWDKLLVQITEYENANPSDTSPNSPTQKVNESNSNDTVTHAAPMLSLRDVFNYDDLTEWLAKRLNVPMCVEPKIDGLSLEVIYDKGVPISASTRGNGTAGEDVFDVCMNIPEIPKSIMFMGRLSVRFEVYMSKERFNTYCREIAPAKNERNLAVGLLKRKDGGFMAGKFLQVWAFDILDLVMPEDGFSFEMETHEARLSWLQALGFTAIESTVVTTIDEVIDAVKSIGERRDSLPYRIDGAVVKYNNISMRVEAGDNNVIPHWAVAYKYPAQSVTTRLLKITYEVGKSGKITPMAHLNPVECAGSTISKSTLYNYSKMKQLEACVGDMVSLHKSGDIIPKITHCMHTPESEPWSFIEECPSCGQKLIKYDVCENPLCPAKLEAILVHWVSKGGLNAVGVANKTVSTLMSKNKLRLPGDYYKLKPADLYLHLGMKPMTAKKLLKAIDGTRSATFAQVISCLAIDRIGLTAGERIMTLATTWEDLYELSITDFRTVLGEADSKCIYQGLRMPRTIEIIAGLKPYFPKFNK